MPLRVVVCAQRSRPPARPGVRALAVIARGMARSWRETCAAAGGRLLAHVGGAGDGRRASTVHAAFFAEPQGARARRCRCRRCRRSPTRARGAVSRRRAHAARRSPILSGVRSQRPGHAPLAAPCRLAAGTFAAAPARTGRRDDRRARAGRLRVRARRGRRRARDRRRARCTPAPSSRGTSASRWSARRCCGSRSASATCTRASSGASPSCRSWRGTGSPRASRATPPWPSPGPTARRSRAWPAPRFRRARSWLRALCLELERIANHLGDLGALGNDAGFAFGLAQFSRLKEQLLRATHGALGQRYLLDAVVPGGVSRRSERPRAHGCSVTASATSRAKCARCAASTTSTGPARSLHRRRHREPELAARLGLIGLAGRASGQAFDLRIDLPCAPYAQLAPAKVGRSDGDVAARVAVRFDELQESCRLVRAPARLAAGRAVPRRGAAPGRRGARHRPDRGLARPGTRRARGRRARQRSAAATRTIPPGRTGRCSSTRSSATSFRISRSSTNRSTSPTAATTCSPRSRKANAC